MTQLHTKFRALKLGDHEILEAALNEYKTMGYTILRWQILSHDGGIVCLLELTWRKEDLDNAEGGEK